MGADKKEWIKWTKYEEDIIKEFYPTDGYRGVMELLPNRSENSIRCKARNLNLLHNKIWTPELDDLLKSVYDKMSVRKIIEIFPVPVTPSIINYRACVLGLVKRDGEYRWTAREDRIIRKYYPSGSYDILCKKLPNRTKSSLYKRARQLGITCRKVKWTEEEIDILNKFYIHEGPSIISKRFPNRTISSISAKAYVLGLTRKNHKNDEGGVL